MSIETWKAEFYHPDDPDPFSQTRRKWTGLTPDNLERHGCCRWGIGIQDSEGGKFGLGGATCVFCEIYHDESDKVDGCRKCPLWAVKHRSCDAGKLSPYRVWGWRGDAGPMLALIDAAEKRAKEKEATNETL